MLMVARVVAFFSFSVRIVDTLVLIEIMVRFAALFGSVGVHAKQGLDRVEVLQVLGDWFT